MGHPTLACQVLRKMLHSKINDGTLELPSKRQAIDLDPLPQHKGKEMLVLVICLDKEDPNEVVSNPWCKDLKPLDAI